MNNEELILQMLGELKAVPCFCRCCTEAGPTYGQVIFYQHGRTYEAMPPLGDIVTEVVAQVDERLFTERFLSMLTAPTAGEEQG